MLQLAEASTCLSLVAGLAAQLGSGTARGRLWQQVHMHMLPLLERCLGELARGVTAPPGAAGAGRGKAAEAAAAVAQGQGQGQGQGPSAEDVAAIVLVCQVSAGRMAAGQHCCPLLSLTLRASVRASSPWDKDPSFSKRLERGNEDGRLSACVALQDTPSLRATCQRSYQLPPYTSQRVGPVISHPLPCPSRLLVQVLDFYVEQRPANADLGGALKSSGVLASLCRLFAAAAHLPGAEPLRGAALGCAASGRELREWMVAVPGVAQALAGGGRGTPVAGVGLG